MQCTSCRLHAITLREYSCVTAVDAHRKTIVTVHLCPICRVMNLLTAGRRDVPADRRSRRNEFARALRA
jgi:hypothetical protein